MCDLIDAATEGDLKKVEDLIAATKVIVNMFLTFSGFHSIICKNLYMLRISTLLTNVDIRLSTAPLRMDIFKWSKL